MNEIEMKKAVTAYLEQYGDDPRDGVENVLAALKAAMFQQIGRQDLEMWSEFLADN